MCSGERFEVGGVGVDLAVEVHDASGESSQAVHGGVLGGVLTGPMA